MKRRTVLGASLAGAIVVTLAFTAGLTIAHADSRADQARVSGVGRGPATENGAAPETLSAGTPAPVVASIPRATLKGLAAHEVALDPVAETAREVEEVAPQAGAAQAAGISRASFGLESQVKAATATLAKVTLGQYGPELQPDLNKPSRVDPLISDRLAWVVTFEDVPVRAHGPPGYTGPRLVHQTVVAFVDPATGEFLAALSF